MQSLHSLFRNAVVITTMSTWRRIRENLAWPLIFLLGNGFGVLLFLYKTLDEVARQRRVDWLGSFIEEIARSICVTHVGSSDSVAGDSVSNRG